MEYLVILDSSKALVELCGISILERCLRTLQLCGITRVHILSNDDKVIADHLRHPSPQRAAIDCVFSKNPPGDGNCLVLRGDSVFDQRLLRWLLAQKTPTVLIDSAAPGQLCGAALLPCGALKDHSFEEVMNEGLQRGTIAILDVAKQSWFLADMHRHLRPYWFPSPPPAEKKRAQNVILDAAQKGTLDIPALVHAPIEAFIVSKLCLTRLTPNQLTVLCNIVAWGATILFASGHLGWGVAVALGVGVLDGLDGKLARAKLETSKAGELEHFFDVLFEYSWWIALAYHLRVSEVLPEAFFYLGLLIGAEILTALARGSVARSYGKSICDLGPFDRFVRLIGGRRNIYVWIFALGLLLKTPAHAFQLIAWWGVVTAAVQVPRAAFALWVRRRPA
ncbi:MAG TPA: CDP-alcohol phosphatidyltransferase family protein [Chthoniobacterales bacterium]